MGSVGKAVQKTVTAPFVPAVSLVSPKAASEMSGGLVSETQAKKIQGVQTNAAVGGATAFVMSGGNPVAFGSGATLGAVNALASQDSMGTDISRTAALSAASGAMMNDYGAGANVKKSDTAGNEDSWMSKASKTAKSAGSGFLSSLGKTLKDGAKALGPAAGLLATLQKPVGAFFAGPAEAQAETLRQAAIDQAVAEGRSPDTVPMIPVAAGGGPPLWVILVAFIVPAGFAFYFWWSRRKKKQ